MSDDKVIEITDSNFDAEVLKSDQPILVDFWAAWCGPCRAIAPVIKELADEYDGRIKIGKCDVDKNPQTPGTYGVRAIPTLILFSDGEVREQITGAVSKAQIVSAMNKIL